MTEILRGIDQARKERALRKMKTHKMMYGDKYTTTTGIQLVGDDPNAQAIEKRMKTKLKGAYRVFLAIWPDHDGQKGKTVFAVYHGQTCVFEHKEGTEVDVWVQRVVNARSGA